MFARGEAALPARGMSALPAHLSQGLSVRCNCTVTDVAPNKVIVDDGEVIDAQAIIDTRPPTSTAWRSTQMMAFASPVPQDTTPVLHLANLHEQPDAPILHACPQPRGPGLRPRESGGVCHPSDRSTFCPVEEVRQTLAGWFDLPADHIEHLTTVEVRQRPRSRHAGRARKQGIKASTGAATGPPTPPSKALCDQAGLRRGSDPRLGSKVPGQDCVTSEKNERPHSHHWSRTLWFGRRKRCTPSGSRFLSSKKHEDPAGE